MKTKLLIAFSFSLAAHAHADSGTWLANPADNNWNNAANWSSGVIPGSVDTASFATSAVTSIDVTDSGQVAALDFKPGAGAYTITYTLSHSLDNPIFTVGSGSIGSGFVNESGVIQNFVVPAPNARGNGTTLFIYLKGSAGDLTNFTCQANPVVGGTPAGVTFEFGRGGSATFHDLGGVVAGGLGGFTNFHATDTTAENCTIINEGGTVSGAFGGTTNFEYGEPTADNAILIANGGTNGGGGGSFIFWDDSTGGTARFELLGNGYLDLSRVVIHGFSTGSIEGDGQVYLGQQSLSLGANNLSTTFAGVIHDGGIAGGSGGSLVKVGSSALTLTGANTYTGGTTVSAGTLVVSNQSGSGTGTGAVSVNAGTLGGSGTISGALTANARAVLAPAHGTRTQSTLTIQSPLTFNSGASYTYTFKAKKKKAKTDKILASGVTINSGATFNLSGTTQGVLTQGLVLTAISNTSATPITGTFSNLADGSIVSVNGNNLQASYEGGDGNDLTLTVVP